jgi:hypothetical protein
MKNSHGRSFVVIMIVLGASALLLRIGIEQLMRITIARNQQEALSTLKLISASLENYAKDNNSAFPKNLQVLTKTTPAYLDRDYSALASIGGYSYSCLRLEASGYRCLAAPSRCGITGQMSYIVTTGGALTQESCAKKE